MKTYKIENNKLIRTMSSKNIPVIRVESGAVIELDTRDCFGSQPLAAGDGPLQFDPELAGNPATGPIYVEGALPGDMLKVEVLEILPTSDVVMSVGSDMGVFADEVEIQSTRIFKIRDGKTLFRKDFHIENKPMLGVIGTAPAEGVEIDNLTPGEHGGNMDCRRIIAGSIVYLPVNTEGALLALGDVHAVMGDGEVASGGAEIAAHVKIKVTTLKEDYECPMVISEGYAMTLASCVSLDDAAEQAAKAMRRFIQRKLNLPHWETCMLLSLVGDLRICQVVDPLKTCRMEVPLAVFDAFGYKFI